MERIKTAWRRTPKIIRQLVVFLIGLIFILLAAITGPLPGPGGIPLFLIGIAILASEFTWAERIRDFILDIIKWCGAYYRQHVILGTIVLIVCISVSTTLLYLLFIHK